MASLEADEASHDRLMGLAKRMVSEAGPPEGKLWADSLLTHARLARLELGSRDAADEIKSFASRYTDCPVAHVALMFAVDMATSNGNPQLTGELSHELLKYREQPVAEAFLRNRGLAVFDDRSLSASLTTLDGTKLRLPRDLLGKVTVLHFWSIRSRDIPFMRAFYDQYHDRGLEVIGINVDRNTREVESFVRQQGLSWPQVSTGKGFDDPLLKRLGVPRCPLLLGRGLGRTRRRGQSAVGSPAPLGHNLACQVGARRAYGPGRADALLPLGRIPRQDAAARSRLR